MVLEDDFCDIAKKARMGQALSVADLAQRTGITAEEIAALERGSRLPTQAEAHSLASALNLKPKALTAVGIGGWTPRDASSRVSCVDTIHGDIGGYAVKGYVLHDSGEAVLVDTGYNPNAVLELLHRRGLRLTAICLTHGHADHAAGIDRILTQWRVPVYLGEGDHSLLSWHPPSELLIRPDDGRTVSVGGLSVRCLATPGHTPGGICYRVEHAAHELCFVGDTLFAGSIGRANPFSLYPVHLESVRQRVLKLSGPTVLFPGHGPNTTVDEEVEHNPFGA